MHELSFALNILEIAEQEARRQGAMGVQAIHVRLGPLSGVVPDALISAFQLAREQSTLAEAELIIEEVPLVAWCPECAAERTVQYPYLVCPQCNGPTPRVVSGQEAEVVALEVES